MRGRLQLHGARHDHAVIRQHGHHPCRRLRDDLRNNESAELPASLAAAIRRWLLPPRGHQHDDPVTSAGIAFGSLAIGAVIFLFLPRFSGGYLSGLNLQPTLISGFSDDVELGEIGEIKKSSAVVMRINVEGGPEA